MSDAPASILVNVLLISKEDATLARLFAERKKIETQLKDQKQLLMKNEEQARIKEKVLNERKFHYQRDEKAMKEERDRLVARRKALGGLGSYKTQQAAAREIEHASREIDTREEAMLTVLGEVDALDKEVAQLKETITKLKSELEVNESEAAATYVNIEGRQKTHQAERERLAKLINPVNLTLYNRIKERYPMDPAVEIKSGSCGGCFMQVPPQHVGQVAKGDALIKCRGCGRILFLAEQVAGTAAAV